MSGSTILLVDDDEVLSQVLHRVLTRDGYTVVQAANVAQAVARAREQPLSLGLIDLRLPDGDGVELARQLKQQVGRFPLILMTANPLRLRDEPELVKEFAQVLTKPLDLDELRRAIETTLATPVRARSLRSPSPPGLGERTSPAPSPALAVGVLASPAPSPSPPSAKAHSKRHPVRWMILACAILAAAALVVGLPALGMPGIQQWLKPPEERLAVPARESQARLVAGDNEIELPSDVVERLGVTSDVVQQAAAPRPLELAGSLNFDPNRLGRIQSRFPGEVISIGVTSYKAANGPTRERTLDYGDRVTKGQIMAVVFSKDLGEKKSELVDALTQLALDERRLTERSEAYRLGALPEDTLNQTRRDVAADRITVAKAERTLRTWKVPEEEINAVKEEARLVSEGNKPRDAKKELEWAKVEVRAPFDGTIVEKNSHIGNIVDASFNLFIVADMSKLGVVVHAYEEDLHTLQKLPRGFPWQVRAGADLNRRVLQSDGLQKIGLVIDPSQHTDPIMGLVDNSSGELRAGQFVTATVNLPAPSKVVSVPTSAIVEDGAESIVFVQPDLTKPRYVRRRVSVAMRLHDVVYVRSELTQQERKKGLQEIKPGESIVIEGVLELQAALEDLRAKAKAQK
jgi:cobalt-zinc-cadmium efflux system membrane fusion protein